MTPLLRLHHLAIICSDYPRSKHFYTELLGFEVLREVYRAERQSYKLDLALRGQYLLELFSFPNPPPRSTQPEATGLRHLAFAVENIDQCLAELQAKGIACEAVRLDPHTGSRFSFFADPDGLPIELYEMPNDPPSLNH
jgi:glyoxylase I family protein